ncbi:putative MADS [Lyophyllum shimeji]|uniref:MADS n=1 Tax=Lyophyllum shimeji TaxID=47721 RepID=A0A9P3PN60_LYOSH|nr:putative MADS [Lyophyllum shimeji]
MCRAQLGLQKRVLINLPFSPSPRIPFPPLFSLRTVSRLHIPSPTSSTQRPPSPTMSMRNTKRQRGVDMHSGTSAPVDGHPPPPGQPTVGEDAFINDNDAVDSGGDDDDDEDKPKADKKAGRRKIKIEFIQDKSRRHITFSKRKAGIMKKAYELSTLTGTQVLLLVVSETGLVYTFTTAKLQPLVTQPEGKNLIQACLNAPPGALPSSHPIGPPINRTSAPMPMSGAPPPPSNLPGGLSINPSGPPPKDEDEGDDVEDSPGHGSRVKRRRRASSNAGPTSAGGPNRGATSPHSPNASIPPLSIPTSGQPGQPPSQSHQPHQQPTPSQIALGASPTSPQQQHQQVTSSSAAAYSGGSYGHHPGQPQQPTQHHQPPQHDPGLYGSHMLSPGGYSYSSGGGPPTQGGPGQQAQLGGLAAAAAAQHGHWSQQQPQVGQGGGHYGRR